MFNTNDRVRHITSKVEYIVRDAGEETIVAMPVSGKGTHRFIKTKNLELVAPAPTPMRKSSHADCDHDKTKSARALCRRSRRAEAAAGEQLAAAGM